MLIRKSTELDFGRIMSDLDDLCKLNVDSCYFYGRFRKLVSLSCRNSV